MSGIAGDGAMYSTTGDLYKWDRALYTNKLVSEKAQELYPDNDGVKDKLKQLQTN